MVESKIHISEHTEGAAPVSRIDTVEQHILPYRIECAERQEEVDNALRCVQNAIHGIGFNLLPENMPQMRIVFEESDIEQGSVNLGHVRMHGDGSADIVFDAKLSSSSSEQSLQSELQIDYPGFSQTLMHEIAHVLMGSVTEMPRQPATRLLDEGWASLIEHIAIADGDIHGAAQRAKHAMQEGLRDEPEHYERCLRLNKAIMQGEDINSAEYVTGRALLHWILEKYGKDALQKLLQLSPDAVRRNDDRSDGLFDEAMIDVRLHGEACAREYANILSKVDALSPEELMTMSLDWQGGQQERALLAVTNLSTIEDVERKFREWLQGSGS